MRNEIYPPAIPPPSQSLTPPGRFAVLTGAVAVGILLPLASTFVDWKLYNDADSARGFGDDMFPGELIYLFWWGYSAIYGAFIGGLIKASFLNKKAWFGFAWIIVGIVFYFLIPASRPSGFVTKSGTLHLDEISLFGIKNIPIPFSLFYLVPVGFCIFVVLTGSVLVLSSLRNWFKNRYRQS